MNFDQLKDNRQRFGLEDPLWAITIEHDAKDNGWEGSVHSSTCLVAKNR